MENGELTNTLKLRRGVVNKNYQAVIDKMYEELCKHLIVVNEKLIVERRKDKR